MSVPNDKDFRRCGGRVTDFDDGHVPEHVSNPTKLVVYPDAFRTNAVHVFHDRLPPTLVRALYRRTACRLNQLPWGTYVTLEDIRKYWKESHDGDVTVEEGDLDNDEATAVPVASHFLKLALAVQPDVCYGDESDDPLWKESDLNSLHVHGIAVWALASKTGSQVPYHLDYAEQVRYQSGIIVPPLLGGTLQCTESKIEGGSFQVFPGGLEHYEAHGYKCKKKPISDDDVTIPYRFNQVICHAGHLPHASTKVDYVDEYRVIVGFNVFANDVGPLVQQAPEHSDAFRAQVQRQNKTLSLSNIKQHKGLSNMLVLAKRAKVKQHFQDVQRSMAKTIPTLLPATVAELVERLQSPPGSNIEYPSATDVHVYLNHEIRGGRFHVDCDVSKGLVPTAAVVSIK